jgi:hypothetical protein
MTTTTNSQSRKVRTAHTIKTLAKLFPSSVQIDRELVHMKAQRALYGKPAPTRDEAFEVIVGSARIGLEVNSEYRAMKIRRRRCVPARRAIEE